MNVRTWLAVSVYMVIVQAFVALKDSVGPHTGERRFKCGHNKEHTCGVVHARVDHRVLKCNDFKTLFAKWLFSGASA